MDENNWKQYVRTTDYKKILSIHILAQKLKFPCKNLSAIAPRLCIGRGYSDRGAVIAITAR